MTTLNRFTCSTCDVAFSDGGGQRKHFKSPWHVSNIKRKLKQCPPISKDDFFRKYLSERYTELKGLGKEQEIFCYCCKKSFSHMECLKNHRNSKRHIRNKMKQSTSEEEIEESCVVEEGSSVIEEESDFVEEEPSDVDEEYWDEEKLNDWLFSADESDDDAKSCSDANLAVGKNKSGDSGNSHDDFENSCDDTESSYSLPSDLDYSNYAGGPGVDDSSEDWEEEDDDPDNDCLFCLHNSRTFAQNLRHMRIVHSFFVPDIEYCLDVKALLSHLHCKISEDFQCLWCNERGKRFRSTEAVQMHMYNKGHCKMFYEGLESPEYAEFYDYFPPDSEIYEEVSDTEEVAYDTDIDGVEYQLVLPSGTVIGHRSMARYYKQKITPKRLVTLNNGKGPKVSNGHKTSFSSDVTQKIIKKKTKNIHYMKRLQAKQSMKLGIKANKFQKRRALSMRQVYLLS